ncbi:hypothetical protein ACPXCX_05655 [Streptomyces sp. DT225]
MARAAVGVARVVARVLAVAVARVVPAAVGRTIPVAGGVDRTLVVGRVPGAVVHGVPAQG